MKVNAKYYLEEVLQKKLLPSVKTMYKEDYYCFQQDGAPSHTAKITQEWCELNLVDFIAKDKWPPSSPDLNPLDFSIWGYMVQKLQNHKFTSLEIFKKGIEKIWNEIPINVVRAACDAFEGRLKRVIAAKGDSIE